MRRANSRPNTSNATRMKLPALLALALVLGGVVHAAAPKPATPAYPRPLRELYSSYFPFNADGVLSDLPLLFPE